LKVRLAPQESAGELRESGHGSLVGRLAKGGQSCDVADSSETISKPIDWAMSGLRAA